MYVMIEKSINYQMLPNSLFKSQTARIDFVLELSENQKVYTPKIQIFWDPESCFHREKKTHLLR